MAINGHYSYLIAITWSLMAIFVHRPCRPTINGHHSDVQFSLDRKHCSKGGCVLFPMDQNHPSWQVQVGMSAGPFVFPLLSKQGAPRWNFNFSIFCITCKGPRYISHRKEKSSWMQATVSNDTFKQTKFRTTTELKTRKPNK